ncbi:hypothetical protein [uncultured Sphingomonas sp.]|uniref:hypothetical protein n=1 Tax=uncultured Sphingomonas sp. TaxID=158754 RepID=UPI0035CB2D27
MYDLIDRPVSDLPTPDRALLRATRAWVHQLTMAGAGTPAAVDMLGGGSEAFDAAMRALDEGSTGTLVFERPCQARVSETEAVWLGIWRLVRADRLGPARAALAGMADADAARAVMSAMVRASLAMGTAA